MSWEIYQSDQVILEWHSSWIMKSYYVDFDINDEWVNEYRWWPLISILQNVIPEFALWHHEWTEIDINKMMNRLREAAKSIYKIPAFEETRKVYEAWDHFADDIDDQCLKRWEFWELMLHLFLRDNFWTIPLLSKIYFKDTFPMAAHWFDAVHIHPESKTLRLWESKLFIDSKGWIRALVKDIHEHIAKSFFEDEFLIISKRIKGIDNIPEKEHRLKLLAHNTKLQDVIDNIKIPLFCWYTSEAYENLEDINDLAVNITNEVELLREYFELKNNHPLKGKLDIVLILFPIKCKNELVKRMHEKLYHLQQI